MANICQLPPKKLNQVAKSFEKEIITLRRTLHEIPELSWEEEKTIECIKEEIAKISKQSIYPLTLIEKTGGLWVDLDIDKYKERILFRADIDALPITENTCLPFSSKHPGKMHACGHECHAAMLLGALKMICLGLVEPNYNLRFVWQRAEEVTDGQSGGNKLIEEGVCNAVSSVYGLHISSTVTSGIFFSRPGAMMAKSDHLKIVIDCSGGHVMHPHIGANAIDIMTDIHNALRGFDLRFFGPNELISFVPSVSNAGNAFNIRPGNAEICYSIRNFLSSERASDFLDAIKKRIHMITGSYSNAKITEFQYFPGHPPLCNSPNNVSLVENILEKQGLSTAKSEILFSGEDFSYYLKEKEGSFWMFGAKDGEYFDHHTSKFNPSEDVLWKGALFWLLLATN